MKAQSFLEHFKAARRVSTPLMAIRTPDPAATMNTVVEGYKKSEEIPAVLCHDVVRGLLGVNSQGQAAATQLLDGAEAVTLSNPIDMLVKAQELPRRAILFMLNADRFMEQGGFVQAVWNLRDVFKADRRTLALLAPGFTLPAAIAQDVLVLDEPYPDRAQLEEIILRAHADSKFPLPSKELTAKAVDALCGLTAFPAEQEAFMSLKKGEGMVVDDLWERKRQRIEQQQGASVWRGGEKFDNICGLKNVIKFCRLVIKGKSSIAVVLFLDELEKMFSGVQGDLSGTSQILFGMLLTWMQDVRAVGILLLGPPGTGKSLLAKAIGNEAGIPTIAANIARMEGSLVGQSQQTLEAFLKMVEAVAGGKTICVVGTCNAVEALPPELRRRFKRGTFFIDLPDATERAGAWTYYMGKHDVKKQPMPDDEGWTAAEIEQCCEMADDMGLSLKEAAEFVVPVAQSAKEQIARLREFAAGRFISASYSGKYRLPSKQVVGQRREVN